MNNKISLPIMGFE